MKLFEILVSYGEGPSAGRVRLFIADDGLAAAVNLASAVVKVNTGKAATPLSAREVDGPIAVAPAGEASVIWLRADAEVRKGQRELLDPQDADARRLVDVKPKAPAKAKAARPRKAARE